MTKPRKARGPTSRRVVSKSPVTTPRRWKLRLSPALRKIAQSFHEAAIKVWAVGEFAEPPIGSLMVRLIFQEPVEETRTAELVKMIQAASFANIAADTERAVNLYWCLDALEKDALHNQSASAGTPTGLSWGELQQRIQAAKLRVRNLGAPTYRDNDAGIVGSLPDFRAIWGQREQYTARLAELETEGGALRDESDQLMETIDDGPKPPCRTACLHIAQSRGEIIVSVGDLLGGPLAGWVSRIGSSASATVSLDMNPRWRDLATAYRELHLESGLLDFVPMGLEGGAEHPLWNDARTLLSQAQHRLLEFLKVACELDGSPAVTAPVPKATKSQGSLCKAVSPVAKGAGQRTVRVERVGKTGSPLKVLVDGVPLRSNAVAAMKVLLAICILRKGRDSAGFLKTDDLKKLVLTKTELDGLINKGFPQIRDNWTRSLLAQGIRLEFNDSNLRFRLPTARFDTSLSIQVIKQGLIRLKEEHPIQRRKSKPSS